MTALLRFVVVMVVSTIAWGALVVAYVSATNPPLLVAFILGGLAGGFGYLPVIAVRPVWRWVVGR